MSSLYRGRLALVALLVFTSVTAHALEVREIRVESPGGRVDEDSVRAYASSRVGDEFSRMAVARDVKALQKSGRFAFVAARVERTTGGVRLVFEVRDKPRLRTLQVRGADFMGKERIQKMLELEPGQTMDDASIAVKAQEIQARYRRKHFPYARVTWTIDEDEESGVADLIIDVAEGDRAKIGRVTFEGNTAVTDRELSKAMTQRRSTWLSWITKDGIFDPDQLEVDLYALKRLFLDRGYLDATLGEPDIIPYGRNRVEIKIPVNEGRLYRVSGLRTTGVTLFPVASVEHAVKLKPGDVGSLAAIRDARRAVRDYYGSRGYIRTGVSEKLDVDREQGQVDITFAVTEGSLAHIRDIDIVGNVRTKDKVIRRELAVYPGEVYNDVKIRRSERRLQNLGYFSTVYSTPLPTGDPDAYDLKFEVAEKKTGQFVVGAGFSSIDELIGFVELSQGNFDIGGWPNFTGGGQKLKLRAQLGTSRTDLECSFTEPWFLDRRLSLNLAVFRNERRFLSDDYNQRNTGGSVTLGKSLGGYNRVRLQYSLQNIDVYDVDDDASEQIKAEEGARTQSAISAELIHDSRNNVFIPARGTRATAKVTLAGGPLAGETDIYRLESRLSHYWSLWFDHVFNMRGRVGVVEEYGDSDEVPIFDREFLGGARTLRGFDFRDVGPKDDQGEAIGGRTSWFATAEYTLPLVARMRLAGFYDIGQVYEEAYDADFGDYNSDAGVGLRFDLPQFPLRLDYAWPLETDEFNESSSGRFNFLIGYTF